MWAGGGEQPGSVGSWPLEMVVDVGVGVRWGWGDL